MIAVILLTAGVLVLAYLVTGDCDCPRCERGRDWSR